tara:strand:+ start:1244 stop:1507 length:264 start_codon:yes stop_codon:yes gene_type:complete
MKKIIQNLCNLFRPKYVIEASYENNIMTIKLSNGSIEKYLGNGTVWHKLPMMERCSTFREGYLSDIHSYIKFHGAPYPNGHTIKEKL